MSDQTYFLHQETQPQSFTINYDEELNEEQARVVKDGDGPCLVLAGAGSGKTRTLVYRVAYLLERGVPPERILLVTFTNKAAREMMERAQALLGRTPKGLWGGTFHSIANRLMRRHGTALGYTNDFGIMDSDDSKKLLTQVHKELGIPKDSYIPKTKVIHSILSFCTNSQKSVDQVVSANYAYLLPQVIPIIERIGQEYQRKKLEANVMDFDDLLSNWLKLLEHHPDIAQRICSGFEYVMVDEFQDTNTVQAKIVQRLAEPQRNVLVVGDDAQSIYSFRAASVENILSFQRVYPEAKIHKLESNYRSTPEILQLANASIRNNRFQYEKKLRTQCSSANKPTVVPARDAGQQAQFITQRTLELRSEGVSLEEIAVLFRSSFHIIELELELNKRGIPYLVRGGLRFFEQAHIKDVLAHLHILQNPRDEISWRRILSLYEGIGPATATKVWMRVRQEESLALMLSAIADFSGRGKAGASLGRLQRFMLKLLGLPKDRIGDVIRAILEEGYQMTVERMYEDAKDRLEDLNQLAIFAGNYATLSDFLSEASLSEGFKGEKGGAQDDEPEELLVLSTIHQAKGLEWDAVFTLGLAEGQFPHYKMLDKPKEMEEERRLFYVAVTRARKHLYLVYPIMMRSQALGDKINRPSVFIREVDDNLYDTWEISEIRSGPILSLRGSSPSSSTTGDVQYIDDEDQGGDNNGGGSIFDMIRNI